MLQRDVVEQYSCESCEFIFWQNSKPTASVIIQNTKREILLTKRGIEPYLGYWDLPGGYLQNGEHPTNGAVREIREELNIEIQLGKLIGIYTDRYGEGGEFTLNLFYTAEMPKQEIKVADDVVDCAWFGLGDIPEKLAFGCVQEAIKDFGKR